jgi:hypothetical protein
MDRRIADRRGSRRKRCGMLQCEPAKRCKIAHQDVGGDRRTGNRKGRCRGNVIVDDGVTNSAPALSQLSDIVPSNRIGRVRRITDQIDCQSLTLVVLRLLPATTTRGRSSAVTKRKGDDSSGQRPGYGNRW